MVSHQSHLTLILLINNDLPYTHTLTSTLTSGLP